MIQWLYQSRVFREALNLKVDTLTGNTAQTLGDSNEVIKTLSYNAQGQVTGATQAALESDDIPNLAISKITNLQDELDAKADSDDLAMFDVATDSGATVTVTTTVGDTSTIPVTGGNDLAPMTRIRITDADGEFYVGVVDSNDGAGNIVVERLTGEIDELPANAAIFTLSPEVITSVEDNGAVNFDGGVLTIIQPESRSNQRIDVTAPLTGGGNGDVVAIAVDFDTVPEEGSADLITSGAVFDGLAEKADQVFVETTVLALGAEVENTPSGERVQTSATPPVNITWSNAQLVDNADDDYITIDANETAQAFDIVVDGRNLYASGNNGLDVAFIGTVRSDTLLHTNVIHLDRGGNTQADADDVTELLTNFGSELWIADPGDAGEATFFTNSYTADIRGDLTVRNDLTVRGELTLDNQIPQSYVQNLEADLDLASMVNTINANNDGSVRFNSNLIPNIQVGDIYVFSANGATLATFITQWDDRTSTNITPTPGTTSVLERGVILHVIDTTNDPDIDTVYLYSGPNVVFGDPLDADNFHRIDGGGSVTSITAGTGLSGGTITSTGTIALNANLNNLTDVVIGTLADDQFLRYNGTNWVNEPVTLPFEGYTLNGTPSTTDSVLKWTSANNLTWSPDDEGITDLSGFTTDDLTEGDDNLYYPTVLNGIIEATPATLGDGFRLEVSSVDDTPVTFLEFTGSG